MHAARSGLASARCSRNNALALADNGVDGVDGDETTAPLARKSRAFIVGIPLDDDRLVRPARAGVVVIFGESDPIRVSFASNSRPNARGVVVIVVIVRPRSFVRVSVVVSRPRRLVPRRVVVSRTQRTLSETSTDGRPHPSTQRCNMERVSIYQYAEAVYF